MMDLTRSIRSKDSCSVLGSDGIGSNGDEAKAREETAGDEQCRKVRLATFHNSVQIVATLTDDTDDSRLRV